MRLTCPRSFLDKKKGKLVISKNATRKKKEREKKRDTKNASTLTVYQLEL